MSTNTPLLILTCDKCDGDMPRVIARGLRIGNGRLVIEKGYTQECPHCHHIHQAGSQLRYRVSAVGDK